MQKRYDVCGLGNALVDVTVEVSDSLLSELGLIKGSMRLCGLEDWDLIYSRLPPGVELSGGSAANTLSGFSRLGGAGAFMGMVGNDSFGDIFTHDLRSLGVEFSASRSRDLATGRCLVLVSADAERTMATHLGAAVGFDEASVDEALIGCSRILYLEGYLFDSDENKSAFYLASRFACSHGVSVALTLSDGFCVDRHRDDFWRFIESSVDILFANESELLSLTESDDYNSALVEVGKIARTAFMTRSDKGSVIFSDGGFMHVDSVVPARLLDSTGAGDHYAAGVLYGMSCGRSLIDSAYLGSHLASRVISSYGGRLPMGADNLFPIGW